MTSDFLLSRFLFWGLSVAIFAGYSIYVNRRIVHGLHHWPKVHRWTQGFLLLWFLTVPLGILSYALFPRLVHNHIFSFFQEISFLCMAYGSFILGILPALELARYLDHVIAHQRIKKGHPAGCFFTKYASHTSLGVLLLALFMLLVGLFNGTKVPPVQQINLPLQPKFSALNGLKIVQLSDLHIHKGMVGNGWLESVVERTNQRSPDLVVITGDSADGFADALQTETAPLMKLQAPLGIFYVTGNHEYYWNASKWVEEFKRVGGTTLLNEHRLLNFRGTPFVLAGVTDYSTRHLPREAACNPVEALAGTSASTLRILLSHSPSAANEAIDAGADIVLSGHTHGGQFFPWTLLIPFLHEFYAGLYRYGQGLVYVSRGTGQWGPPVRLFAPAEITELTLKSFTMNQD